MKKKDLQEKLFQLRLTRDQVEQEISELEIQSDPVLKDGFYVAKGECDGDKFTEVFHVFEGYLHCMNGYTEVGGNATKTKVIKELTRYLTPGKVTFKKVPAQEAISYLKG